MANKKQLDGQSVVEKLLRVEPDEQNAHSNIMSNINDNIIDNISYNTSDNMNINIIPNTNDNILINTIPNASDNILNNIISSITTKEPAGGNYTFYLSADVADQLAKTAKKMSISKSKLVDSILREILLGLSS